MTFLESVRTSGVPADLALEMVGSNMIYCSQRDLTLEIVGSNMIYCRDLRNRRQATECSRNKSFVGAVHLARAIVPQMNAVSSFLN